MPSLSITPPETVYIAGFCSDDRMDLFELDLKKRISHLGGRCLVYRTPGGGSKLLTSEAAMHEFMNLVSIALEDEPKHLRLTLANHNGVCRGLRRQYGANCDVEAVETLPLAKSHLLRALEDAFPDREKYPEGFWNIDTLCVDV